MKKYWKKLAKDGENLKKNGQKISRSLLAGFGLNRHWQFARNFSVTFHARAYTTWCKKPFPSLGLSREQQRSKLVGSRVRVLNLHLHMVWKRERTETLVCSSHSMCSWRWVTAGNDTTIRYMCKFIGESYCINKIDYAMHSSSKRTYFMYWKSMDIPLLPRDAEEIYIKSIQHKSLCRHLVPRDGHRSLYSNVVV